MSASLKFRPIPSIAAPRSTCRVQERRVPARGAIVVVVALLGVLLAFARAASADLALEYSGATEEFTQGSPGSLGWSFTTHQAIEVTALDVFDPNGSTQVRLYDATATTLASATVSTADPTEGSPTPFYTHAIAPVLLSADTTYYIAQDDAPNTNLDLLATGLTTAPAITFGSGVLVAGAGQDPLTDDLNGGASLQPGYFGPNFDFQPAPAAPLPGGASAGLLCLGAIGLFAAAARARSRRASPSPALAA